LQFGTLVSGGRASIAPGGFTVVAPRGFTFAAPRGFSVVAPSLPFSSKLFSRSTFSSVAGVTLARVVRVPACGTIGGFTRSLLAPFVSSQPGINASKSACPNFSDDGFLDSGAAVAGGRIELCSSVFRCCKCDFCSGVASNSACCDALRSGMWSTNTISSLITTAMPNIITKAPVITRC